MIFRDGMRMETCKQTGNVHKHRSQKFIPSNKWLFFPGDVFLENSAKKFSLVVNARLAGE